MTNGVHPDASEMDLDGALDEIYAVPRDRFVERRDELARRLRERDEPQAAEELVSRRKPTIAAWALNQLTRRHPDVLRQLAQAAEALRDGETDGRDVGLREAMSTFNEAVARCVSGATTAVEEIGSDPDAHRDDIASTLRAAAADEDLLRRLLAGRLRKATRATDVSALAGLDRTASATRGEDEKETPDRRDRLERRVQQVQATVDRQQQRVEAAEERAGRLRERTHRAEQETDARRQRLDDLRDELEDLHDELDQLRA